MEKPYSEGPKSATMILKRVEELLANLLVGSQKIEPELLSDLLWLHARVLQTIALANKCETSGLEQKTPSSSVERALDILTLRAVAARREAVDLYAAGWWLELCYKIINGKRYGPYAQFRRRESDGSRPVRYIGKVNLPTEKSREV